MMMFEDKTLNEKLNKIKKQILYREELEKIQSKERRYLERKNEQASQTNKNP